MLCPEKFVGDELLEDEFEDDKDRFLLLGVVVVSRPRLDLDVLPRFEVVISLIVFLFQ